MRPKTAGMRKQQIKEIKGRAGCCQQWCEEGACSGKGLIRAVGHSNCLWLNSVSQQGRGSPSDRHHPWARKGSRGPRLTARAGGAVRGSFLWAPTWITCFLQTASTLFYQHQTTCWRKLPNSPYLISVLPRWGWGCQLLVSKASGINYEPSAPCNTTSSLSLSLASLVSCLHSPGPLALPSWCLGRCFSLQSPPTFVLHSKTVAVPWPRNPFPPPLFSSPLTSSFPNLTKLGGWRAAVCLTSF